MVVHQLQTLAFEVGKGDDGSSAMFLDLLVLYLELLKSLRPPLERLPARNPQSRTRNFASTHMVRGEPQIGPVEEGDLRTRPPQLVPVEQVVCRNVVLVDRLLYKPQPQDLHIERDVLRSPGGHCRNVV
jgi:hypothetical protein